METNEQISLVKKLHDLKSKILQSNDREEIILYIKEAIRVATPVPACIDNKLRNKYWKTEFKQRTLALMEGDIKCIEDMPYPDWEDVYFQVVTGIVMLISNFVDE